MKTLKQLGFMAIIFTVLFTNAQDKFGGLALYTLREEMPKDVKGTLEKVAALGYQYVEAAGYADGKFYGMAPAEFKALLESLGLKPVSSHNSTVTLENADQMIADVKAAGFEYFVIPIPPMGHFTYDAATRTMGMSDDIEFVTGALNTIGKKCHDAGLKLLYHNHDFEFKPNAKGIVPIEYFLENTSPEHVNFQMDLFWVVTAGANPIDYFKKYPGRFVSWHVKDKAPDGRFAPVGQGTIDFAEILRHKETSGMKFYLVEQDMTWDLNPFEAIKISREGLKKFGFN